MTMQWIKDRVVGEFGKAGVIIGGSDVWDIEVKNQKFYSMVFFRGHDGLADAYMKGYWVCAVLDQCLSRLLSAGIIDRLWFTPANISRYMADMFKNKQNQRRAKQHIASHYDLGEVFKVMLDPVTMCYSCGYWLNASTLEEAQIAKLDLICRKLGLQAGMRFLDVGCGWGGLIRHATSEYGCDSTGITLSRDQLDHIRTMKLNHRSRTFLSAQLTDYREVVGLHERIASVGMFEHVGILNYRDYMCSMNARLSDDGLFLLHTIGACDASPTLRQPELAWIEKHIFPGAVLPSFGQIASAADGIFKLLDVEEFGAYYDPTLMAWAKNFEAGWESIKHLYPDEFYRMWRYYLYACAAGFRTGRLTVWQAVFAKRGWCGRYQAVRP